MPTLHWLSDATDALLPDRSIGLPFHCLPHLVRSVPQTASAVCMCLLSASFRAVAGYCIVLTFAQTTWHARSTMLLKVTRHQLDLVAARENWLSSEQQHRRRFKSVIFSVINFHFAVNAIFKSTQTGCFGAPSLPPDL